MDRKIIVKVRKVLTRFGVKKSGIFGSVARGDDSPESDVDILVEFDRRVSLLQFVGLKLDLEESLGRKVDLVEYTCIKESLRETILAEEIRIL